MCLQTIMIFVLLSVCTHAQVLINEIHPTPPGGEPEWVECIAPWANADLSTWYVCDARTCVRLPPSLKVAKGGVVVLTRDAEALREARTVPRDAVVVECVLPSLNNTTDVVMLRDADSVLIDSVSYRVTVKGRSIERDADGMWAASLARDSATCGYLNSRVVLSVDVRMAELRAGGPVPTIDVIVENRGRRTVEAVPIAIAIGERTERTQTPALAPMTSWTWKVPIADVDPHAMHCVAWTELMDDRSQNDTIDAMLLRPPVGGTVVITEVMFDPANGQCDYVEVYNGSDSAVDLEGWALVDESADTVRAGPGAVVHPGSYGVLATDTIVRSMMEADDRSRLGLVRRTFNINSDGEMISLCNPSGFVVDVVHVLATSHVPDLAEHKGVSLEKWSPTLLGTALASWTSSGDLRGGTPGRSNSVERELPPHGVGAVHASDQRPHVVRFRQPFRHASVYLRILTRDGLHVRSLLDNVVAGTEGAVVWDAFDDAGRRVAAGPYVVVLDAYDIASDRVIHAVGLVVTGG